MIEVEKRRARHLFATQLALEVERDLSASGTKLNTTQKAFISSGACRYWILCFTDTVIANWDYCESLTPTQRAELLAKEPLHISRFAPKRMSDHLRNSQDPTWYEELSRRTLDYWTSNGRLQSETLDSTLPFSKSKGPRKREISATGRPFLSQTYLSRAPELMLGMVLGTLPSRWREPKMNWEVNHRLRSCIEVQSDVKYIGTVGDFVRKLIPFVIPQTILEQFDYLVQFSQTIRKKPPRTIFTANLHLASDSFIIWAWKQRELGSKIVIAQHGGLYGQGVIPMRAEEFERFIADKYLNWGWELGGKSERISVQSEVWKRKRRSCRKADKLLLITDCTLRHGRHPWSPAESNQIYKSMIRASYRAIPDDLKASTIIRLHHDHNLYDDGHQSLWKDLCYPTQIDNGLGDIETVRKDARLVVCTTLGTSEIVQFRRSIPTILRLDPNLHAVREPYSALFRMMENAGLVHYSELSFNVFLRDNWGDIDNWWTDVTTQKTVKNYLEIFGFMSDHPLRHLRSILS